MFKILRLPLFCFITTVLPGCATIEYYEFLEPQRSANQQFIDTPYVYSGLVEMGEQSQKYQFSGVLYDADDKILNITIPTKIAYKQHAHNRVELSNGDHERKLGEPALLVVNPHYPFNLDVIKSHPRAFVEEYYLKYQPLVLSQGAIDGSTAQATCPHILLLNIDLYEELPTTLEFAQCQCTGKDLSTGNDSNSYVWQTINEEHIINSVEHDKVFGYQVGYLGFLITVPFDVIVSPFYTLGWGLVASKNLLLSVDEEEE